MYVKSARIIKPKEPLEVQEIKNPKPSGSQVLIKVQSCGDCHSDIHLWEGGYTGLDGQFMKTIDRGVKYPLAPGHEIAGLVWEMGENAKETFKIDDKVMVYPWIGECLCPACKTGNENLCDHPKSIGVYNDGGYAGHG